MILYLFIVLVVIALAGWFWLTVLKRLDRYRADKKSFTYLVAFFFFGLFSIVPTIVLGEIGEVIASYIWGVNETANEFFFQFLLVGPVEEFSKFFIFFIAAQGMRSVKEPRDAVLQAAAVALAFASVENVSYGMWYGVGILLERSLLTVLGHMTYSTLWSVPYAEAVYGKKREESRIPMTSLLRYVVSAAFVHGLFNFLLYLDGLALALMLDILVLAVAVMMYATLAKQSPYKKYSLKEGDRAIARIKPGLRSNPHSYLLNKRMGIYLLHSGRYDEALLFFNRCVRIRLKHNDAWFYRAVALFLLGREEAGRSALKRVLLRVAKRQRSRLYAWVGKLVSNESMLSRVRGEFDSFEMLQEGYGEKKSLRGVKDPWKYRNRRARLWSGFALTKTSE